MPRESQTERYRSPIESITEFGYTSEDADRPSLFDLSIPDTQSVPHRRSTIHLETLKSTFGNINEHLPFESQKQVPVKFDPSPMLQNFDLLAARSVFVAKAGGSSRSLGAVVETLVEIVGESVAQLAASLTTDDYQRLAAAREKLIDTVGEDENHFFAPLINFITNLIRNCDEESNPSTEKRHRPVRRRKRESSPANRSRVKLADLLPQDTKNVNASSLKPRRPEHVGRPDNRPRVKLSDLLSREAEHIATREADHEMQMDNEV